VSGQSGIRIRYQVVIDVDGVEVIDEQIINVLRIVKERGSLLAASKSIGMPYSRLWERISKIERLLGRKLLLHRRGGRRGGGSVLTEFGETILKIYGAAKTRLEEAGLARPLYMPIESGDPVVVVSYSHDPVIELILKSLSARGFKIRGVCSGSGLSLAMLVLGEADISCIHIYDPGLGEYNKPYLERFGLLDRVEYIGGFQRQVVLAYRGDINIDNAEDAFKGILEGRYRVALRNRGSGTRAYFDYLLKRYSEKLGIQVKDIKGLEIEYPTHEEVCRSIESGETDIGLTIRYTAEKHGLKWIHIAWEPYECYVLKNRVWKSPIEEIRKILSKNSITGITAVMPGYRVPDQ